VTGGEAVTRREWVIRQPGELPIRGDLRHLPGSFPRRVVVIVHGFKGFRRWGFFPPVARDLARRGYAVVTFDLSRNGVGDDGVDFSALERFREHTHSRNLEEIALVLEAVRDHLLPQSPQRIGLLGHSRGGAEALVAAARDSAVDALVTWAAVADLHRWTPAQIAAWERGEAVEIANARTGQQMPIGPGYWQDLFAHAEALDPRRAAATLEAPWLIVHGSRDASVTPEDAHALRAASGGRAELLEIEGGDHGFGTGHPWKGSTPEMRAALTATAEWFDRHLG
jgi:uncharacterized protein